MRQPLFLFLVLISISFTFAQSGPLFSVAGKVTDADTGQPLEYATVVFKTAGSEDVVNGGVTDASGEYDVQLPVGEYDVSFEFISFRTETLNAQTVRGNTRLPDVMLRADAQSLDEVVVRAETTEVQVQLDKKIYNIGQDLTARGATVSDALSNVPSVSVDVDGTVALRGNENVRILINGRPSALAGFGDVDALTQLPAEIIERVEVITSPSARYDAEGTAGILNIILKKDKVLGFNGSLNVHTGTPTNNGFTANLNLRKSKFNIFNTTGYAYRKMPGSAEYDNTFESGQFSRTLENRTYDRLRKGFNTNLGIQYFLTETSSVTTSGFLSLNDNENRTTTITDKFEEAAHTETSERLQDEDRQFNRYQVALNYTNEFDENGHKLEADLQYSTRTREENILISENNRLADGTTTPFPGEEVYDDRDEDRYLAQMDYVRPMGENARLEAGYRGNFRNDVTDYRLLREDTETGTFVTDSTLTNVFDFTENIQAAYTQYGNKFGQFSFLLGLRYEYTRLTGKIDSPYDGDLSEFLGEGIEPDFDNDYSGLFPTVNLIYELNERENITLGYNRRINRPRGWFINPFPSRASVTNMFQGNPNLAPAFANAFDLGYLKRWDKITLTSSVYFQRETESFEFVQQRTGQEVNGIEVLRTLPINLSIEDRIGAEAGFIYNPARWLRTNGSFNFFQFNKEGAFEGTDFSAENTSWFARLSTKVTLPAKIDWQNNLFFMGPTENAQTKREGMVSWNVAISKDLFNDNATILLNVSDLLNSRRRIGYTEAVGFTSDFNFQWRERQVTLSFMYRFNQQKHQRDRERRNGNGNGFEDEGFGGG